MTGAKRHTTIYKTNFDEVKRLGEHNDTAGVDRPYKPPKVGYGPLIRSLSHHVRVGFQYTLR